MNARTRYGLILLILVLALLSAACRPRQVETTGPTLIPTAVPTLVSTPLPLVPTAIPPGEETNPLRMVILPYEPEEASALETEFETMVQEEVGAFIDVVLVEHYSEVLAALCDSGGGMVSVAWLGGISYAAAAAQNCGSPMLQVRRSEREDIATGVGGQLIMSSSLGTTDIAALRGRTFCRLGYDDFYSWLLPSLIMETHGINPLAFLEEVVDYDNIETMLSAVAVGEECAAAGVSVSDLDAFLGEDESRREGVRVVETTAAFPYGVLMVPLEVPLSIRLSMETGLLNMASVPDMAEVMRAFLGQDLLVEVAADDFADLNIFMESTGLDFAQLGD